MSDKITDNENRKTDSESVSTSAASAFRKELEEKELEVWNDPRILINRPESGTSEVTATSKSTQESKAIAADAFGADIKHGIVTTYDEDGNPTSDCFGPIPRPIKGFPIGKPGGLGNINLPPIDLHYPKK